MFAAHYGCDSIAGLVLDSPFASFRCVCAVVHRTELMVKTLMLMT
jgi:hypothetical protein